MFLFAVGDYPDSLVANLVPLLIVGSVCVGLLFYAAAVPAWRSRLVARLREIRDYFLPPPADRPADTSAGVDVEGSGQSLDAADRRRRDVDRLLESVDLSIYAESDLADPG